MVIMPRRKVFACVVAALAIPCQARAQATPSGNDDNANRLGWPQGNPSLKVQAIDALTIDESVVASSLITIRRMMLTPGYAILGSFDDTPYGPSMLLIVEEGEITVVPQTGAQYDVALLVDLGDPDDVGAQIVMPETRLTLGASSLLAPAASMDLFLMNESKEDAAGLVVTMFPEMGSASSYGSSSEELEINLGVKTVRDSAPPIVKAARVTLSIGESSPTHDSVWPRVIFVESGSAAMSMTSNWHIRRRGREDYDSPVLQQPNQVTLLERNDAAYLPLGVDVALSNAGDQELQLMSLSIVPATSS